MKRFERSVVGRQKSQLNTEKHVGTMLTVLPKSSKFPKSGKRETQIQESTMEQRERLLESWFFGNWEVERNSFADASGRDWFSFGD